MEAHFFVDVTVRSADSNYSLVRHKVYDCPNQVAHFPFPNLLNRQDQVHMYMTFVSGPIHMTHDSVL